MAGPRASQSSGHSRWKQWWKRSPNTCCSKKILLLLVWYMLFSLSSSIPIISALQRFGNTGILFASQFLANCLAPLIGWLADVKFGRYGMIKFGSLVSFLASILYYFALLTTSTLSKVLFSTAIIITNLGGSCYYAAMLPFLTDQLIGATSDELSSVVRWYYWTLCVGTGMGDLYKYVVFNYVSIDAGEVFVFAVPLAVIIISDGLCQQWLDRTHKVTNPIKLIIQVLNYTKKHSYPERRSAFTYIDEEQPTRMDYGKEKFGGPFTEEEVEDVKTVLRLLPLVICLSLFNLFSLESSYADSIYFQQTFRLFPLLLIPVHQFLVRLCFRNYVTSMLHCITTTLFIGGFCFMVLQAIKIYELVSDDVHKYISCGTFNTTIPPVNYVEWYWKVGPYLLYGIGGTVVIVLFLEFMISQSPDKMKGLVIGISFPFCYSVPLLMELINFTLCHDILAVAGLVVLFVVFLVLSKRYTLRERNREINIQAIVEEHYERYMDQEEEYMRQQNY